MSKTVDYYDNIIAPLPQPFRTLATIESLRFEKELYRLCINNLNKQIEAQDVLKTQEGTTELLKESINLFIMELECRIMERQSKMRMCDIHISREQYNLKNFRQ